MSEKAVPREPRMNSELLRRCMIRSKLEVVCTLLKSMRKEVHVEKPGEFALLGEIDRARDLLLQARVYLPLKETTE